MLMPMENCSRLNMLQMQLDSVLLTLVFQLLLSMMELHQPSTPSLLLLQFSQELPPNQLRTPLRLLRLRLLILLFLKLLMLLLKEKDVMLMPQSSVDLQELSLLPLP